MVTILVIVPLVRQGLWIVKMPVAVVDWGVENARTGLWGIGAQWALPSADVHDGVLTHKGQVLEIV